MYLVSSREATACPACLFYRLSTILSKEESPRPAVSKWKYTLATSDKAARLCCNLGNMFGQRDFERPLHRVTTEDGVAKTVKIVACEL